FPEVELYWLLNGTGTFPSTSSSPKIEPPVLDLPNTEISPIEKKEIVIDKDRTDSTPNIITTSDIDQIVIFYKDGSFKAYK
ncbi:MAG: transcriptional regulator, partial [Bacteroidetes bacterium]|nr:transcriptional regulator [Bacteroidota bacterium]